jgi:hypothetical protein
MGRQELVDFKLGTICGMKGGFFRGWSRARAEIIGIVAQAAESKRRSGLARDVQIKLFDMQLKLFDVQPKLYCE